MIISSKIRVIYGIGASLVAGFLFMGIFIGIIVITAKYGVGKEHLNARDVSALVVAAIVSAALLWAILKKLQLAKKGWYFLVPVLGIVVLIFYSTASQPTPYTHDAKMLSNVRQLAAGLELYHNDHGDYPNNLNLLIPQYIGTLPAIYSKDSVICTDQQSSYTYERLSSNDYKIDFCFNKATGGYTAGKHELRAGGVK